MQLQSMLKLLLASFSVISLAVAGCSQQRNFEAEAQPTNTVVESPAVAPTLPPQGREPDVPFVPTPNAVVEQMLKLANVSNKDVLYDLGSGDGRIPITAVQKYGASRAVGVDINPQLVQQSQANAQKAGVANRVNFVQQDLFQTDLSDATVVTLYLLPEVNLKLRPKLLQELRPGTRVVSHNYDMGDWKPDRVVRLNVGDREHIVYSWVVPQTIPETLRSRQ